VPGGRNPTPDMVLQFLKDLLSQRLPTGSSVMELMRLKPFCRYDVGDKFCSILLFLIGKILS